MTDLSDGGSPEVRSGRSVNLSAADLRQLRRLLAKVALDEQQTTIERPRGNNATGVPAASALARAVLAARDTRKIEFASAIFGEPAWDMLLNLFVHGDSEALTVTRLAQLSGAPLTTAIRWIDYLDQSRLISRRQSANDARMVLVELTDEARSKLESYFDSLTTALAVVNLAAEEPVEPATD